MSIRIVKAATGERLVLLTDGPHGLPDTWVAGYSIMQLRRHRPRSIRNGIEGIAKGLAFFRKKGVNDFGARIAERLPSSDELGMLAKHLEAPIVKAGRVSNREEGNAIARAPAHFSHFVKYAAWLHEQLTSKGADQDTQAKVRVDFLARAHLSRPINFGGSANEPRRGLTEYQRDLFQRAIVPGPTNPFEAMQVRNYLLLGMSFNLGLRSGELLGLKIPHLELGGRRCYVSIKRTPDDVDDDRRLPPGQKTLERVLAITTSWARTCDHWLEIRDSNPAARKHDFLFVNQDGAPLGDGGFRKIYHVLRRKHPDLGTLVNHMLRHDWNDRWSEMNDELGSDLKLTQDQRAELMGWKPGSKMAETTYGRNWRRKQADKSLLELQSRSRKGGKP